MVSGNLVTPEAWIQKRINDSQGWLRRAMDERA